MGVQFVDLIEQLDPDDNRRGKQFERICKWFLDNDPGYSFDRVWLWDQWPGRWGGDCGIDLVARDHTGRIWAIQAKCYAATTSITKSDVDKFLSESNRPEIDVRLLVVSTNNVAANATRVMKTQDKPVHQVLRSGLDAAPLVWPEDPDDLSGGVS